MSIFKSPFVSCPSTNTVSLSIKTKKISKDDKISKRHRNGSHYAKRNLTSSLLEDFETGSGGLGDVFEFPSKKSKNKTKDDDFNALLLDRPFVDYKSFYEELNIENNFRMRHTSDLDFNNVQKLTIELDPNQQEDESYMLESLVHDLSIDEINEIDSVARSSHHDNEYEDYHDNHPDFSNNLRHILDNPPNYDDHHHVEFEDIFNQEEFHDYDFGNTNSHSNYFDPTTDLYSNISNSYNPSLFNNRNTNRFRNHDVPYIYEDKPESSNIDRSPRRACLPTKSIARGTFKPAIKPRRDLLNLIVESSDGNLDDATKYATEINSQNCQGIPIPEKTTEVVTIPTSGPQIGGVKKAAIVKAIVAKTQGPRPQAALLDITSGKSMLKNNKKHLGFYTSEEQKYFLKKVYNKDTEALDKENEECDSEDKENQNSSPTPLVNSIVNSNSKFVGLSKLPQPKASMINTNNTTRPALGQVTYSSSASKKKSVTWAEGLEW